MYVPNTVSVLPYGLRTESFGPYDLRTRRDFWGKNSNFFDVGTTTVWR